MFSVECVMRFEVACEEDWIWWYTIIMWALGKFDFGQNHVEFWHSESQLISSQAKAKFCEPSFARIIEARRKLVLVKNKALHIFFIVLVLYARGVYRVWQNQHGFKCEESTCE